MPTESSDVFVPLQPALEAFKPRSRAAFYRQVNAGKIRTSQSRRPNGRPETLFSLPDVERIARENSTAPTPLPAIVPDAGGQAIALRPQAITPPAPRLVLTPRQAAEEFGLPEGFVLNLARAGVIGAIKYRGWLLSRRSLEDFINNGFVAVSPSQSQ